MEIADENRARFGERAFGRIVQGVEHRIKRIDLLKQNAKQFLKWIQGGRECTKTTNLDVERYQ